MNRAVPLSALWTASAAAAVGLGFLAVSLVDASGAPPTSPVAATTTASAPSTTPQGSVTRSVTADFATVGGTAYADCTTGLPKMAGAPLAGWRIDDSSSPGAIEFRNGPQRVEVRAACIDGAPQFASQGPRVTQPGSSSPASLSPGSPWPGSSSAPASPSASDRSGGRGGGGHGSDDPAGDDSSGRTGGGHGSDG
jgi:hypothetical protein